MASRAVVILSQPGLVVVRVAHLDSDSFSRSVDRVAVKAWRNARHYGEDTNCQGGVYAPDGASTDRKCVSWIGFAGSFGEARGACEAAYDAEFPAHL